MNMTGSGLREEKVSYKRRKEKSLYDEKIIEKVKG